MLFLEIKLDLGSNFSRHSGGRALFSYSVAMQTNHRRFAKHLHAGGTLIKFHFLSTASYWILVRWHQCSVQSAPGRRFFNAEIHASTNASGVRPYILSRICQIFRLFVYGFEFAGLQQDAQQTLEGAVHELPEDAEARHFALMFLLKSHEGIAMPNTTVAFLQILSVLLWFDSGWFRLIATLFSFQHDQFDVLFHVTAAWLQQLLGFLIRIDMARCGKNFWAYVSSWKIPEGNTSAIGAWPGCLENNPITRWDDDGIHGKLLSFKYTDNTTSHQILL